MTMHRKLWGMLLLLVMAACADNTLETKPNDDNFPFQIILDTDEGADLPDAEDYSLEIKFADYLPDQKLPNTEIVLHYSISNFEDDMAGAVTIDKIIYEVEIDDCIFERELEFTATDKAEITGTILLTPDDDLGGIPELFEIVFTLPGLENTAGAFTFEITDLQSNVAHVILGSPRVFEYEVLDNDVAGEWELNITSAEEFDAWKEIFAPISGELEDIEFEDITGKIVAEFEFQEMKWVIELAETEEITVCEEGESETEIENKVIEIEAEYEAEDGELVFEGSHVIFGDDNNPEDELDFMIEATYEVNETLQITFFHVKDEDNFEEGEELFQNESGYLFELSK